MKYLTLRQFRHYLNIKTQKEMGSRLGVSAGTYGQWEQGRRRMSEPTMTRMCEAFECIVTVRIDGVFFTPIDDGTIVML